MIRPTVSDSFGAVSQLIGAKWKELDPTEKDEWRERAKKLNASREDEDEDEMLDGELDDALDGEMWTMTTSMMMNSPFPSCSREQRSGRRVRKALRWSVTRRWTR